MQRTSAHAMHPDSIEPAWRGHPTGAPAGSDLTHLGVADLWIHGHVHANADYVPGGRTRVPCDPFGYGGVNAGFDEAHVVALPVS